MKTRRISWPFDLKCVILFLLEAIMAKTKINKKRKKRKKVWIVNGKRTDGRPLTAKQRKRHEEFVLQCRRLERMIEGD
jgi:hypothetical protein